MIDRTPDGTPTVNLGGSQTPERAGESSSAFDPPADRFATQGELGRGGMGRVDKAFDRALDRPVAIKHMLSTAAVDLKRFEREARITAQLEHPGIVPIHDVGRNADGTPYYVMRAIDGQPLDQRVEVPLVERLALIPNMLAACDALAFAHARGVIHRDIKPTNILIGPFGETLVIDWGLARRIAESDDSATTVPVSNENLTRVGTVAGTPGFMSPEQARGEAVDARADVFALGATLYFVLAGALPYGAISATEMIGMAGAGRSADWLKIPPQVPPELVAITKKAMAPETEDRYRDAGELAADLRRFITGNLVGAYAYGLKQRLWRFVRRHRAAFVVAVIAFAVVVTGAAISVRRVIEERDGATRARKLAETREREAQSSADLLLVQHALELANTDPVAAIVALRALKPDSERWAEARIAAQSAMVKGIPFGYAGMQSAATLQMQRDSRHVLIADLRATKVMVLDLIAHTRISAEISAEPGSVAWIGPDHVAYLARGHTEILDLHTHAIRTLSFDAARLMSDRGDKIWLFTKDWRLIEIVGPAGEPHELARDLTEVFPSPELTEAVLLRGRVATVWTPTSSIPLATAPASPVLTLFEIRGRRIAMLTNEMAIHLWHLDRTTIVDDGNGPSDRFYISVTIAEDRYFVMSRDGFGSIAGGRYYAVDSAFGLIFETQAGIAEVETGNLIRVIDSHGRYNLGHHAAGLARADVSVDGRFVVGLTETGDVLAWDLVRPRVLTTSEPALVVMLGDRDAWTSQINEGVHRIDLATGTNELVVPAIGVSDVVLDRALRWILLRDFGAYHIIDVQAKRELDRDPLAVTSHDHGLIEIARDGQLRTWDPGEPAFRERGRVVSRAFTQLAADGSLVLLAFPDHVERLHLDTGRSETAKLADVTSIGIQAGTCWMITTTGVLRWPLDAAQPSSYSERPTIAYFEGSRVLFDNGDSLTYLDGATTRTIAHGSKALSWDGGSTVATLDARGVPSVVDLATGLSFTLPTTARTIASHGDLMLLGTQELTLWRFDVPRGPAALAAWFDSITNAKTVPGTGAYTWP